MKILFLALTLLPFSTWANPTTHFEKYLQCEVKNDPILKSVRLYKNYGELLSFDKMDSVVDDLDGLSVESLQGHLQARDEEGNVVFRIDAKGEGYFLSLRSYEVKNCMIGQEE